MDTDCKRCGLSQQRLRSELAGKQYAFEKARAKVEVLQKACKTFGVERMELKARIAELESKALGSTKETT